MTFAVSPLPGSHDFGAVITGLAPAALDSPDVATRLRDLWIDKGLLVFQGMQGERRTQLRLSRVFGALELHPIVAARTPEEPELISLAYRPGSGDIVVVDGEERGAYLPWHSDLVYVDRINRGGVLRAVDIPPRGGSTGFIDQIDLYRRLPEDLKARIEGLSVIYHLPPRNTPARKKFGKQVELRRDASAERNTPPTYGFVAHPMVYRQKETGRPVLNVSPWFAVGIEHMETPEGDELLARIVEHCEADAHAYFHAWRHGDMVLWDNWRMLHCAAGVPVDATRRVERTTIEGDYKLGRLVRGPVFTADHRIDV